MRLAPVTRMAATAAPNDPLVALPMLPNLAGFDSLDRASNILGSHAWHAKSEKWPARFRARIHLSV